MLALVWVQLAAASVVILVGASLLTKSADVIAIKTGLGRAFIGVILLATATSLPELGTGISAVKLLGEPDLAAGDAFGSNLFNLMIIGLLDMFYKEGSILRNVSVNLGLVGTLGIALTTLAGVGVLIHSMTAAISNWYISPISVMLILTFIAAIYMIYRAEKKVGTKSDTGGSPEDESYVTHSLHKAALTYLVAATVVVGGGIWLAHTGDVMAKKMGWEASFVGTQFLAFSTSLPELATAFAAIRLNAPELAVSNLLGSNIFNMGFVLFVDDVVYSEGVFWGSISDIHSLTALIAIGMTSVVVITLLGYSRGEPTRLGRSRGESTRFWKVESLLLIGLYVTASLLIFALS